MQHYPIIIIGAGLAGVNAAYTLQAQGHRVLLIDKARGTGGRASSKRLQCDDEHSVSFDMGLSAFEANSAQWQARLATLQKNEQIDLWFQRDEHDFYCGRGRNSVVTRALTQNCDFLLSTRVLSLASSANGGWHLSLENTEGKNTEVSASHVIITAPAQQASAMLPNEFAKIKSALTSLSCHPSFVTLVATKKKISSSDAIMKLDDNALHSIAFEHSKPQRDSAGYSLLKLQASTEFSMTHLDDDKAKVGEKLIQAAEAVLGPLRPIAQHTHRWLYSQYADGIGQELIDRDIRLSSGYITLRPDLLIASDYAYKAYTEQQPQALRVSDAESACLSGMAAAEVILESQLESA